MKIKRVSKKTINFIVKGDKMKKKYFNLALIYAICGMVAGVFYREFTKWNSFTGVTALGKLHTHLLTLGMLVFLLVAIFSNSMDLEKDKKFKIFMKVYNIGLPILALTMLVRGVVQVRDLQISKALDASISGIAGIGHMLVGLGIVLFLLALRNCAKK